MALRGRRLTVVTQPPSPIHYEEDIGRHLRATPIVPSCSRASMVVASTRGKAMLLFQVYLGPLQTLLGISGLPFL